MPTVSLAPSTNISPVTHNAVAPVLDGVDSEFQDIRFKYSLWYQSPFKGPPSPQVEEAWQGIMKCNSVFVALTFTT